MPSLSESLGQNDDNKPKSDDDEAKRIARKRHRMQQDFLKICRSQLTHSISVKAPLQTISPRLSRVIGPCHHAIWTNLWPMIQALSSIPTLLPKNAVIILGGWMLPPPKDIPTGAVSPSAQLFADLFWHEIYAGINSRFETLWKDQSDPTHAINNLEYEKYRKMTRPFFTDEELKNSSQQKIAEAKAPEVLRNIERSLYFLEGEAMIFYPTPSNPYLGWEDFWSFVRAYESLPLKLRLGFGKYYLMIQTP